MNLLVTIAICTVLGLLDAYCVYCSYTDDKKSHNQHHDEEGYERQKRFNAGMLGFRNNKSTDSPFIVDGNDTMDINTPKQSDGKAILKPGMKPGTSRYNALLCILLFSGGLMLVLMIIAIIIHSC